MCLLQYFGPNGQEAPPPGSVIASYRRHANPYTRRYTMDPVPAYIKMFLRASACANVRVHGCGDGVSGVAAAESAVKVMYSSLCWTQYLPYLQAH